MTAAGSVRTLLAVAGRCMRPGGGVLRAVLTSAALLLAVGMLIAFLPLDLAILAATAVGMQLAVWCGVGRHQVGRRMRRLAGRG